MDLSICIPVFQHDVSDLVFQLVKQGEDLGVDYELCLLDDGSAEHIKLKNRLLIQHSPRIRYRELAANVGRATIRNRLAALANGQWLIFLDNDVSIDKPDFLSTYYHAITNTTYHLFCGGCEYPRMLKHKGYELKYTYGKQIEEITKKQGKWYSPFLAGNFMVHHGVFHQIQFDERLTQYGYEDLVFALDFESHFQQDYQVIYNPVQINEIDETETFLRKTKQAVYNLATLFKTNRLVMQDNIRLLLAYHQLKQKGLLKAFYQMTKISMPLLLYGLSSNNPNLKLFQLYKLFHFIDAVENNKTKRN